MKTVELDNTLGVDFPLTYVAGEFASISVEDIDAAIIWENRQAPRSEAYYACADVPYTYGEGRGQRTYHPMLKADCHPLVSQLWNEVGGSYYELLFCNRYEDQHQHLGWHADDSSSVDPNKPICVLSFGAERDIWFKKQGEGPESVQKLTLGHGSALVMKAGMQQTHYHRIPKHDKPCGVRVSLTFRGLTPELELPTSNHRSTIDDLGENQYL